MENPPLLLMFKARLKQPDGDLWLEKENGNWVVKGFKEENEPDHRREDMAEQIRAQAVSSTDNRGD